LLSEEVDYNTSPLYVKVNILHIRKIDYTKDDTVSHT
jgi:hypothetical protein